MFLFEPFPKIARLKREQIITEKLDGTNAQVSIFELNNEDEAATAFSDPYCVNIWDGESAGDSQLAMYAGSRKRWIAPEGHVEQDDGSFLRGTDNFGFAAWVHRNSNDLKTLGPGQHFGEWYGSGIQRNYGLDEKRFALFNVARWGDHNPNTPDCCHVVPRIPYDHGGFVTDPDIAMTYLKDNGSFVASGFMNPEGIIVYHSASRTLYKQTFEQDGGKWRES